MKQTAVKWLEEQILKLNIKVDSGTNLSMIRILDQALEMEKEQIIETYKFGVKDEYVIGAEQYYNEKFKNK